MTDVDRKTKNIVVRCLRPYKGYGLLRERLNVSWCTTVRIKNIIIIIIIYLIIRRCARTGAFPGAFCVPNSVALASPTLWGVQWAIH